MSTFCHRCRTLSRFGATLLLFGLLAPGARAVIRDGGIDPANLGKGDWIYQLDDAVNRFNGTVPAVTNVPSMMIWLKNQGMRYIIVKAGTGGALFSTPGFSPQFTSALVNETHAAGLKLFGYTRSDGKDIPGEINVAKHVFDCGGDGFVFDAEIEWETRNLPDNFNKAIQLCSAVRAAWPNKFLAHAPFPIISVHSSFPYKEFGYYCDAVMPQDYWVEIGYTPSYMVTKMSQEWRNWQNSLSGIWVNSIKPIVPLGQAWNGSGTVTAAQITEFVNALKNDPNPATPGGYKGVNYWVAELHPADLWAALRTNNIGFFPENTAPAIDNVRVSTVTDKSATLVWTTDQSSDSVVDCGLSTGYGSAFTNPPMVWYHVVTVTNLNPDTTYHYRVKSRNALNYLGASADYVFTTTAASVPDVVLETYTSGGVLVGNPPYSDAGFVGSGSTCKSTVGGLSGTLVRYATGGGGTPACTVKPTLAVAGGAYDVYITHCATSCSADMTANVTQSGGVGLPATTPAFRSAYANSWVKVGTITLHPGVTTPTITFTYAGGTLASTSRMYSDAFKFAYVPPPPSAPVIAAQPQDVSVSPGSTAAFSVLASGTAPLSYQWRFNGAPIDGATGSAYLKNNAQAGDAGSYSVVITNGVGATSSTAALLTVLLPPSIVTQPADLVTGLGLNPTFTVTAAGTPPLGYQWQFNGSNIAWGTASSLTITNAQATDAGPYTVTVSSTNGTANSTIAFLTVQDPFITSQPQHQAVAAGATASFSVSAVGTGPLAYQWFKEEVALTDGPNLVGAQGANLTVQNVQAADMAYYWVVVSNANGQVASTPAALTGPFAPHIYPQPASQKVVAGSSATLTVSALGTGLSCQWRKEGTNLLDGGKYSGVNSLSLLVSNVEAGEVGNYSVVVSNSYGQALSSNAVLGQWPLAAWGYNVNGQTDIPAGMANVLGMANGSSHALALKADATVVGWGAGTNYTGVLPYFAQAVVPADLSDVRAVAGGGYHSLALRQDGTVVAWGAGTNSTGVAPRFGQAVVPAGLSDVLAISGGFYHSLALKKDGTVVAWGAGTSYTGSSQYGQALVPADLSNVVAIAAGYYHNLALKADGTVVAWGAGTNNTGTSPHYGQSSVPADLTNAVAIACGSYHSLAVRADGSVVAWGQNNLGQAGVPELFTNAVGIAAGINYSLVLKADGTVTAWGANNYGQASIPPGLSNVVVLSGGGFFAQALQNDGRPYIFQQPVNQLALAGQAPSLSVRALGLQPLSYQWQREGVAVAGATEATLVLSNVESDQAGNYTVVVSNAVGTAQSVSALVVVRSPARITSQPVSQAVVVGAPVSFSVEATGEEPLSYQWRHNGQELEGAVQSTYSLSSAQETNAGSYSVVVSNLYGQVVSSNATLTVTVPPTILAQPQGATVNAGADAAFLVTVSGTAPFSYQWQFNHAQIPGATNSSYTRPNVQSGDAGSYSVIVSNAAGYTTSADAVLAVNLPPTITAQPQSVTTNLGAQVAFAVTAGGTAPLSYQWRLNGTDLPGATNAVYSLGSVTTSDVGRYSVVVSNVAGARTSEEALLALVGSALQIDSITLLSGQGIQLQMSGGPGDFAIEFTPDFSGWTQLETLTATGSVFQFTDPDTNQPSRYYRVRSGP